MADPRDITPDALEILVARDLRKAGLELDRVRRERLDRLPPDEEEEEEDGASPAGFVLDLSTSILAPRRARLLVRCFQRAQEVGQEEVQALAQEVGDAGAADESHSDSAASAPEPRVAAVVVTSGFTADARAGAREAGVALLRVADARAAYDASGWGPRGSYPMWLPEYALEIAIRDPAGMESHAMLGPGDAGRIIDL